MRLRDRASAGNRLAPSLSSHLGDDALLVGLAPGGVIVAHAIAALVPAAVDVLVTRGVHAPGHPHFLIGAVASGIVLMNRPLMRQLRASRAYVDTAIAKAAQEVADAEFRYRGGREADSVDGRTVILVDDGLASDKAVRVAIASLRQRGPERLIFASPFCDAQQAEMIQTIADEVVCLHYPRPYRGGHLFYDRLEEVVAAEVQQCVQFEEFEQPDELFAVYA